MKKESIRVAKIHICVFEKNNENQIKIDIQKYPDRLCVIDEEKNIVIDVQTKHQYPYIRTVNRLYFASNDDAARVKYGKRNACFEYHTMPMLEFTSLELDCCNEIIKQLKQGVKFLDGNEVLTNEEYLEAIKNEKTYNKVKKMIKKEN